MSTQTQPRFDDPSRLNEDGTVTLKITPSNWRCYNISPDTYSLVNGDSWTESTIEHFAEKTGRPNLAYDDLVWTYDSAAVVRGFAQELADWISEILMEAGVESLRDVEVTDTWSPQFYNFTSDGFEVQMTLDPAELRALNPDFDVDAWVAEYYRSVDGFASFVPSRMQEEKWRVQYDGEFLAESVLALLDEVQPERHAWRLRLHEAEHDVYDQHTKVEVRDAEVEIEETDEDD